MNHASFLQSPEWQEIQERMGRPCSRIAGLLVIQHDLPFGLCYLYCPRPASLGREFLPAVKAEATRTGAVFLKVDPAERLKIENLPVRQAGKLKIFPSHTLQPQSTVSIDCACDDAALLSAMHPKTRYNIRLAERKGVSVRRAGIEEFGSFFALLGETARRDRFSLHPAAHYRALLGVTSEMFANELWVAERNGTLLAAAVVNWFKPARTATYLHGASSFAHRAFMAPHLLHFRLMQEARERGFGAYDFGGIDERRWPGVTRFKKGFGGAVLMYPPSQDAVFRPFLYRLWRFQHALRHE